MADVGTVYAGTQTKWGYAKETTYGTAIADDGAFQMVESAPPAVDYGITRDRSIKYDGSRIAQGENKYYSDTGGVRVISFSDMIVRRVDLANLLYAVLQANFTSEGAATPYTKVFTVLNTVTQGDFTAAYNASTNRRMFYTIGIYDPIASYMRKFTSCILRTLTLSWDAVGGDGRLRASGEWISNLSASTTANFSGTWGFGAQYYFNFNAMSARQLASTDLIMYTGSLTFTNNAVRNGASSTGYGVTFGLPSYQITGNISAKYDTVTQSVIADSIAGTGRQIQVAVGTAGQAGHFDVTMPACSFDDAEKDYGAAEGQKITLPFEAMGSSGTLATITLSDGSDQTW